MTAVFRVIMMLVGYIWACIAASAVLTFGTLAPNWDDLDALGRSLGNTSGDVPTVALWSVIAMARSARRSRADSFSLALFSWPQAARISRPRGVRTGEA